MNYKALMVREGTGTHCLFLFFRKKCYRKRTSEKGTVRALAAVLQSSQDVEEKNRD